MSKQKPAKPRRSKDHRVPGVFQRTKKGYGFVRPTLSEDAGQGQPTGEQPPPPDIYIPAKWTLDAASGDVVLVQTHHPHHGDPGPRGEIVEVVERQTRQFVGTYFESRGLAYVQIDGTLFAQPIYVGDPGAKSVRADDKVVVEMVRFPSPVHDGEGVILEVLGPGGKPGVDTLSIIREFGLPEEFADDALAEARAVGEQFTESLDERLDLTGETIVTIDPVDARDFDDAISLQRLENGHWRLGVHIADVSHFVRPRTALDREAHSRATSVYLPDRVLPMLPETISNSLASLQPGKVRYTKTVFMEFTAEGVRTHTEFHSAAIRSTKRLTYEQVDGFLADRDAWHRKLGAKVHALLGRMHELAMMLRGRRIRHGALVLNMPEVKVDLDSDGRVSGAHVAEDTESHQIIEEFMLAANESVAELLRDKGLRFLRRIHESPSPHKLRALTEFVRELGLPVKSLESRFELQRVLDEVKGRPEEHAVNYAMLRAMQRAVYSPAEEGHYALASDCYCHFTSPIRRYPDLTVHRLIEELLTGRKPRMNLGDLVVLGQHCSDREQRAAAAERDLTKLKLLAYLSDRVGEEMDGIVTGVESFGLFVQGLELPAEGLIHADALADDYYFFDRTTHTLSGRRHGNRYRLGDRLRVAVARVDLERRELDFRLVESKPRGKAKKESRKPEKTKPRKRRRE
jgi:ribonuclease R